jgi:hypothetical protein
MSAQWKYQIRIYLDGHLAEAARFDPGSQKLKWLSSVLAKHRAKLRIDRALLQSRAPGDRRAPPLQGRTNKTVALDPAATDPSWPIPAADRVNVRESLFAEAFNGLLQQNRHV